MTAPRSIALVVGLGEISKLELAELLQDTVDSPLDLLSVETRTGQTLPVRFQAFHLGCQVAPLPFQHLDTSLELGSFLLQGLHTTFQLLATQEKLANLLLE
jgi:hypothetical protein